MKCKDQLRQWLNNVLLIYLKIKKFVILRNIEGKIHNVIVYKAWLNSLEGAEQPSSSWAIFIRSQVSIKCRASIKCRLIFRCWVNFRCRESIKCWVKFRCRVMFMCWASVKSQFMPSNTVGAEYQFFDSAELLHYLKSHRFAISQLT